jgi:hypothetical protein
VPLGDATKGIKETIKLLVYARTKIIWKRRFFLQ